MSKTSQTQLRNEWTKRISELLSQAGEEVLMIDSHTISIPTVDSEGEDQYLKIVVSVPAGTRDGEVFDGHALAKEYEFQQEQNRLKAEKKAHEKARKIERDAKMRAQKEAMKAKRNT